jgi:hypothetical protein
MGLLKEKNRCVKFTRWRGQSRAYARKWKQREEVQDRSHRAHHLQTTLTPTQETLVVELRRTRLLPLDDLLVITRESSIRRRHARLWIAVCVGTG